MAADRYRLTKTAIGVDRAPIINELESSMPNRGPLFHQHFLDGCAFPAKLAQQLLLPTLLLLGGWCLAGDVLEEASLLPPPLLMFTFERTKYFIFALWHRSRYEYQ